MSISFATPEWAEQLSNQLRQSTQFRTESMSWIFGPIGLVLTTNTESTKPPMMIRIDLHDGALRGIDSLFLSDAKPTPFIFSADLTRWESIFTKNLDLVDLVLNSHISFSGDLPTFMRHRGLFSTIVSVGSTLETIWQDEQEPASASAS